MRTAIRTTAAPAAVGPYSQAIRAGNVIFSAGQLGIDPRTGKFAGDNVVSQAQQVLQNVKAVLEAAGADVRSIVKTTIFVVDMDAFKEVNQVYGAFMESEGVVEPPARSTVEVSALPLGGLVEIEAIAVVESE